MQNLDLLRNHRLPRSLFRDVWSVFDEFDRAATKQEREETYSLACDIHEADGAFLVSFDAPGLKREDINIEMIGNQLKISGERKREREVQEGNVHRIERSFGKFSRTFELPEGTNAEGIEASYESGVLKVAVPKAEATKVKKISIGDSPKGFLKSLASKLESKTPN